MAAFTEYSFYVKIIIPRLEVMPPELFRWYHPQEETVKIRIAAVPPFICLDRQHHYEQYLEIFVGLEFVAKREPENDQFYQVTVEDVQNGLWQHSGETLALRYWVRLWLQTQRLLSDPVYFPIECCELIEE